MVIDKRKASFISSKVMPFMHQVNFSPLDQEGFSAVYILYTFMIIENNIVEMISEIDDSY